MKIKEIRELSIDEMRQKSKDLKEELFKLRIRYTSGQLETPSVIGSTRKDIARLKTVLREKGEDR
ncbi:MAG: 50S ribosomal protein L29 [Syntrophales bacterium]